MSNLGDDRLKAIRALDKIAAAITQTSPKYQNKLTSIFAAKLGMLGTYGGVMGLLSLGTASTGTAIASLSGAAATTAKLFWVGSIVGGGVAAGGFIIGAASLVGGYFAASRAKRLVLGVSRDEETLENEEKLILDKCRKVSIALQVEERVSSIEFKGLSEAILDPMLSDIDQFYFDDTSSSDTLTNARTINLFHLARLHWNTATLREIIDRHRP